MKRAPRSRRLKPSTELRDLLHQAFARGLEVADDPRQVFDTWYTEHVVVPDLQRRLTPQMRQMLRGVRDHNDSRHHCRTQSEHGGACGTEAALHRLGLLEYKRNELKLTALGAMMIERDR